MKKFQLSLISAFLTLVIVTACKSEPKEEIDIIESNQDEYIVSEVQNFTLDTITMSIDIPWGMAWLPNGDMIVTDRSGKLYRVNSENEVSRISGLPAIHSIVQGGLLDVEIHPNYEENGWIYFAYSSPSEENENASNTAIMRAKLEGNALISEEKIFQGLPYTERGHHYGSRIEFDNEGYLYFSIGDRGERDMFPQKLINHNGKIMRIHDDGSIPVDNPFVNDENALNEIYSYGHRNPQGVTLHPETGKIWIHEHGPRGGDEINIIDAGKNYGWPEITFGINYDGSIITEDTAREGMEQPLWYWTPSIAPCGMDFIEGDIYENWKGDLFVGSLVFRYLERCVIENNKVTHREKLLQNIGRVRNVKQAPDGYIYVATETPGAIYRIVPKSD